MGVRAVAGEKTAFAYSDDLSWSALLDAALPACARSAPGQSLGVKVGARKVAPSAHPLRAGMDPIATLDSTQKVALLEERSERLAKRQDRAWCRSWPGLRASTTWCWSHAPTARWRPTCAAGTAVGDQ